MEMLIPKESYNLNETLHSGQAFRWNKSHSPTNHEGDLHEGIIDGIRVRLVQSQDGVEIITPPSNKHLRDLLYNYLSINHDLEAFYKEFSKDQYLSNSIKTYRGLHILRQNPWECLIGFICSANNNIPRIKSLVESISVGCGTQITDDLGTYYSFPTPKQLNDFGEQSLRSIGLGFRAKYVAKASAMIDSGQINLDHLKTIDYNAALAELLKIPGVGDKVANCVLLFSLEKLDSFPVDVWINRVMKETYIKEAGIELPNNAIRAWAQTKFGPFAGYANQYLFHARRMTN